MAPDYLQVVCQPTRIRGNLLAHVFATWDMVVSANVSSRLFAADDWVKPSDHTQAQLPIDVQLVLPACFRVISANVSCRLFVASDGAKSSVFLWAKLSIGVQLDLPTRFRVVSANVSFGGQFVASDEVRSSVHVWAKLANCVLGVDADHIGLYGDASSYYGIVEQQGRLTLHLHMLLWIRGALTPQEIRDRIMDPESDFQKKWLNILKVFIWVNL